MLLLIVRIREYITQLGINPFAKWFDDLDSMAATKVAVAISRMEAGNLSNIKWFSGIGEYKINWGPGYRIYLAKDGEKLIILFGGGVKKSQKKDIEKAKLLFLEYKQRKGN